MGDFAFNGISALSFGLQIEKYPVIPKPRKRMTSIAVPGRSGDLHLWDGSYEDVTIRYICWWKNSGSGVQTAENARAISEWLYTAPAAARLEDTYNNDVFREATFIGPMDVENILERFGRVTLEFRCSPKAFLKYGEDGLVIRPPYMRYNNPTAFTSKPLIEVSGSVSGLVTINTETLLVRFVGSDDKRTLHVDCETQEAWEIIDGEEVSRNEWVSLSNYPTMQPGVNEITIDGGIELIRIYPRFYTL